MTLLLFEHLNTVTDADYIIGKLSSTTLSWPQMVKRYGSDWHKWPTVTSWWQALNRISSL